MVRSFLVAYLVQLFDSPNQYLYCGCNELAASSVLHAPKWTSAVCVQHGLKGSSSRQQRGRSHVEAAQVAQRASLMHYSGLAAALQRFLHPDLRNTEQAMAMDRFAFESPTSRCWGPN